ncbi:MAG: single-stranded-DNA-specific exonuclease RecJ [Bacteroidota bacterium]
MTQLIWKLKPLPEQDKVHQLSKALKTDRDFPLSLANILVQRGIETYESARAFFVPQLSELHDPFLMKDMDKAIAKLIDVYQTQSSILLFGDYDVDGTSAVSLLTLALEELGFRVEYYIPDRYKEGYGLSYQGVDHAAKKGIDLMICLDCGIKAVEKVRYAQTKGIEVIICDHHNPGAILPDACAILDPKRPDCSYPFKELTGCGVGVKLLVALVQKMKEQGLPLPSQDYDPLARYVDLLTLSIACDIVPITGENRAMAFFGLKKLRTRPIPGIQSLLNQAKEERKWNISDLVFFVGPRINSAGRLHHARGAVEVLLGKHEALIELAQRLHQSNEDRKNLDKSMTQSAMGLIASDPTFRTKSSTVLFDPAWHKGVIGIVASRLIESHFRPTVLLTQSEGKLVGSARSVPGFDLYRALDACSEHLLQWGGHKYAAGLSMNRDQLEEFQLKFDQVVASSITPEQQTPVIAIDQELHLKEIDERFVKTLDRMEPFGPGNRKPVFMSKGVRITSHRILKQDHVKFWANQDGFQVECIGFNLAQKWQQLSGDLYDIAYQPTLNTWNNRTTINLRLKDIQLSHANIS